MKIVAIAIAVVVGGWLAFDGTHALIRGNYVTRGGELGPWSRLIAAAGVNPRSTAVKALHVALGALWLSSAISYAAGLSLSRAALIGCSVLTLWYLPLGTVLSLVEIAVLLIPVFRK